MPSMRGSLGTPSRALGQNDMAELVKKDGFRFSVAAVERHMRGCHPACPPQVRERLVQIVSERAWAEELPIGKAVGIVTSNYVRHRMTDYDLLLRRDRLSRAEARICVASEVNVILARWKGPSSC